MIWSADVKTVSWAGKKKCKKIEMSVEVGNKRGWTCRDRVTKEVFETAPL